MAKKTNQTNNSSSNVVEKLARICWNTNGWVKPSGEAGKSKDKKTFEGVFHFGFEEWLFDSKKNRCNVDEANDMSSTKKDDSASPERSPKDYEKYTEPTVGFYRYGFLQQLNSNGSLNSFMDDKRNDTNQKDTLTLHLYTISPYTYKNGEKIKLYIGCIKNVKVLDGEEQEKLYHHFFSTGRLTQMYNDVYNVGGKWPRKGLLNTRPEDIFNIKFELDPNDVPFFYPRLKELDPKSFKHYDRYIFYPLTVKNSISMIPKTTGNVVDIKTGEMFDRLGNIINNI